MNLEYKETKHVYDEDGNMYEWYGEMLNSGYVVRPVYATLSYWCHEQEPPEYDVSYGKYTILEQVFDKPPVQKKEEKITELENKIKELEEKIKEKERKYSEISWATTASPEEIIKKKLKHIPEIDYLIKALNNELCIYKVTNSNKLVRKNTDYVAIHLNDKEHPVHFFMRDGGNWKKYNCNDIKASCEETAFSSQEDAEKFIIQRLLNKEGIYPDMSIETVKELSDLFVKYNIPEPDYWQEFVKSRIAASIEADWNRIADKYAHIKDIKKDIRKLEVELAKREEFIKEKNTLSAQDIGTVVNEIQNSDGFLF